MLRYRTTSFISRLGSWPVVLGSGIAFSVFAAVFFASSAPFSIPTVEEACGAAPLDMRFYSSRDDVHRFLTDCEDGGRAAYRNMQIADLVYPVIVGLFMTSALSMALRRLFPDRPLAIGVAGIGLLASAFDYLENVFAWTALAAFPEPAATDGVLGLASSAKTISSWLAGCMLIAALLALGVRRVRRRLF